MAVDDRPTMTQHHWRLSVLDRIVGARRLPVETIGAHGDEDDPGAPAPDYEVVRKLGKGGMAIVLDVRQTSLDRDVALKVFVPNEDDGIDQAEQLRQFAREAVFTAQLDHPNIVPIYSLAKDHRGRLFFTMKKIEGLPWRALLHPGEVRDPDQRLKVSLQAESFDWKDHIRVLLKVMDAVAYAHSKGVLHRDLKPSNIMVGDFGEVYVLDWGLAMPFGEHARYDDEQIEGMNIKVVGTPRYMAPEMLLGRLSQFSEATDVHLLGGILYEIVTGQPPRKGRSTHEIIAAVAAGRVDDPARVPGARHVTPQIRRIILKAMAANPADRYPNVTVMRADLEAYLVAADALTLGEDAALDLASVVDEVIEQRPDGNDQIRVLDRGKAAEAYERLSDCIDRFRQSLARFPVNGAARSGLLDAVVLQIQLALRQGDLTLAEARLRVLEQVPGPGTDEMFTREVQGQMHALGMAIANARGKRTSVRRAARGLPMVALVLGVLAVAAAGFGYAMFDARREAALVNQGLMFQTAVRGRARMIAQFLTEAERVTEQYRDEARLVLSADTTELSRVLRTPAGRDGFYLDVDYYDPATAPRSLRDYEGYGSPVSMEHPTVVLAPWIDTPDERKVALSDAARLARLGRRFGQVHRSWGPDLKWSLAGTPTGLLVGFPGSGRYRDKPTYDPTQRPWYRIGIEADGEAPIWGTPYVDATTGTVLMPCVAPVKVGQATMAVVGVEVTVESVQRALLDFALGSANSLRAMLIRPVTTRDARGVEKTAYRVVIDTQGVRRMADWKARPAMPRVDELDPAISTFVEEVLKDRERSPKELGNMVITHAFLTTHDWLLVVTMHTGDAAEGS